MAAFVQGHSYMASDPFFDSSLGNFNESSTLTTALDDHIFHVWEVREMDSAVASSIDRISPLPPRNTIDELTEGLESLSIFGRTKAQVVLDPTLNCGSDAQFQRFMVLGDGDVVPVVTLEEMKGIKFPPYPPAYTFEGSSPDDNNVTLTPGTLDKESSAGAVGGLHVSHAGSVELGEQQCLNELLPQDNFLDSISGFSASTDIPLHPNTADEVPPLSGDATPRDERQIMSASSNYLQDFMSLWDKERSSDISSSHSISTQLLVNPTQLSIVSDPDVPADASLVHEFASIHPAADPSTIPKPSSILNQLADVPDSSAPHMNRTLGIFTDAQDQLTSLSFDFNFSDDPRGTRERVPLFTSDKALCKLLRNNLSSVFPIKEALPRQTLPYPIERAGEIPPPSSTTMNHFDFLLAHKAHKMEKETPSTNPLVSFSQLSEASTSPSDPLGPPGLSPSYTESSMESMSLRTPVDCLSPTSLSFASHKPLMDQMPMSFMHSLPSQDALANITPELFLNFDIGDIDFELVSGAPQQLDDNSRRRVTYKAAEVHEKIMEQVAPYTLSPSPPKKKSKGKAKAQAGSSTGSNGSPEPCINASGSRNAIKKKKKREEADKVRCEIGGCNGTFFSNWELKRHLKNLHGIGAETHNAVCPKCGRHFASKRKDSVDRHLELNACGKRNPRKPPRNHFINTVTEQQ